MLREHYQLPSAGVVELGALAAREGFQGAGLQRLSSDVLGAHLDKRPELRCGDWEAPELSADQLDYAAKDAHVAVDLFARLYTRAHPDPMVGAASPSAVAAWCAGLIDTVSGKPRGGSTLLGIDLGSRRAYVQLTVMAPLMVLMTLGIGGEIAYGAWIFSYATERARMPAAEGVGTLPGFSFQ